MHDIDAARAAYSENDLATPRNAQAPHRPNTAAVLEVLAALELEFKAILNPPATAEVGTEATAARPTSVA